MSKKKVFALRLEAEVYSAIEQWAADEFRSTNGQLEWIISKALKDSRRFPSVTVMDPGDKVDDEK